MLRSGCMLYRYFDLHGRLLYVGITTVPELRDAQHRSYRGEFRHYIALVEYERYTTVEAALDAELRAIQTEDPVFNIARRDREVSLDLYEAYLHDPASQVINDMARWVTYERARQRSNFLRGANQ